MTHPSSAADEAVHSPYVSATDEPAELTPGVIILGVILGLMFAASSVYLALKVSLTVSASIPVAVLSITIFRYISRVLGRPPATILQNNMVQTTGSAGESIASGISFTLPALLLLGYNLPWSTVTAIGVVGGILGVVFMIPLRRSLIVKEHANLKYPEGTACAQVLIVGEQRGVQAKTVFMGFGLGALYKFLTSGFHLWLEVPKHTFQSVVAGGRAQLFGEIQAEISPELTGVGYIIGPRISGYLFGGGVLAWFTLIPGDQVLRLRLHHGDLPGEQAHRRHERERDSLELHLLHRRRRGDRRGAHQPRAHAAHDLAGARRRPARLQRRGQRRRHAPHRTRHADDRRRRRRGGSAAWRWCCCRRFTSTSLGAVLALFFSFLFVTVSSRITGQIGSSSNPISGMTVATLLLTSLMFLAVGWVGIEYRVLALSIGGVVCVAAATAGATSQDLKTGFLVGATPARQQVGLLFGVTVSALLVGGIIYFLNAAKTTIVARDFPGVAVNSIETGPLRARRRPTQRSGRERVRPHLPHRASLRAGRHGARRASISSTTPAPFATWSIPALAAANA